MRHSRPICDDVLKLHLAYRDAIGAVTLSSDQIETAIRELVNRPTSRYFWDYYSSICFSPQLFNHRELLLDAVSNKCSRVRIAAFLLCVEILDKLEARDRIVPFSLICDNDVRCLFQYVHFCNRFSPVEVFREIKNAAIALKDKNSICRRYRFVEQVCRTYIEELGKGDESRDVNGTSPSPNVFSGQLI